MVPETFLVIKCIRILWWGIFLSYVTVCNGKEILDVKNEDKTCAIGKTCSLYNTGDFGLFYTLHNSLEMEKLGFGTAGLGENTYRCVRQAIAAGFRHFDSAQADEWYQEAQVGSAINDEILEGTLTRGDLFVVTKVHPRNFRKEKLLNAFETSLKNLRSEYVDLILLHYAGCWPDGTGPGFCPENSGSWFVAWDALEELYQQGKVKAIGVSNFEVDQLDQLWDYSKTKPHVVQNWFDPFHQDEETRRWCSNHNVLYTGYSTFGSQWVYINPDIRSNPVFGNPVLRKIAKAHGKTINQVVLSWALQKGVAVIPSSSNERHIQSNAALFHGNVNTNQLSVFLSEEEIFEITSLDGQLETD